MGFAVIPWQRWTSLKYHYNLVPLLSFTIVTCFDSLTLLRDKKKTTTLHILHTRAYFFTWYTHHYRKSMVCLVVRLNSTWINHDSQDFAGIWLMVRLDGVTNKRGIYRLDVGWIHPSKLERWVHPHFLILIVSN
jgi:hypothetical protein